MAWRRPPAHFSVMDTDATTNEATPVLYARRRVAKQLKTALEAAGRIDGDYRMGAADPSAFSVSTPSPTRMRNEKAGRAGAAEECIFVPVTDSCLKEYEEWCVHVSEEGGTDSPPTSDDENGCDWKRLVVASGRQHCMPSASATARAKQGGRRRRRQQYEPTLTQKAIIEMVKELNPSGCCEGKDLLHHAVVGLSSKACPHNLERFGDNRCLIIPRTALRVDEKNDGEFRAFLELLIPTKSPEECLSALWSILARLYSSPRVARRGDIDPESKVRQSGHRLLYPSTFDAIEPGIPSDTGSGAPGWITVTENGIQQSLDFTRVMFSRGNVTEKIRFGKLVQEGDVVLDMYAGIGYYTLPALIHGRAARVYCCEWNPDAVAALKYNLSDNGVDDRAIVLEGDSRKTTEEARIIDCVDRVSLGLLPSCEGGWKTAVQALRTDTGGWLHVHGNVPTAEKKIWVLWISYRLAEIAKNDLGYNGYVAVCCNLEKVKSFAPKVDHYVADIWVGPRGAYAGYGKDEVIFAGILTNEDGETTKFEACSTNAIKEPSCALKKDGVLHQDWMM